MRTYNNPLTTADLEELLDIHGADPARWPDDLRDRFDGLLARDRAARELLRAAEALDSLLAKAPLPDISDVDVLAGRIVAAQLREKDHAGVKAGGGGAAPPGKVIAWPGRRKVVPAASLPSRSDAWGGAALLAASLVLGVFIGASNPGSARLQDLAVAAGLAGNIDPGLTALDQNDLIGIDEEAL